MPKAARTSRRQLPKFISPMLISPGEEPSDSNDWLYEVKWDGMRALAYVDGKDRYRLINRHGTVLTEAYPELHGLGKLPSGTVLDGELICLREGKPELDLVLSRMHLTSDRKIKAASRGTPATFIAFDQLYIGFESILRKSLEARREALTETAEAFDNCRIVLSETFVGSGKRLFNEAVSRGLEGIVGKRRNSTYLTDKRTTSWLKFKRSEMIVCVVIGFTPDGDDDFEDLYLAAEENGTLRYVGKVGCGFTNLMRRELNEFLWSHRRAKPVTPCKGKGVWVEPAMFGRVTYLLRTSEGHLREPVFREIVR